MRIINYIYIIAAFICFACAVTLPELTESQVNWAAQKWPGVNSDSLNYGRKLYIDKCSGCHGLRIPSKYSPAQWDEIMPKMAKKAKLNNEENYKINRYVITLAKK